MVDINILEIPAVRNEEAGGSHFYLSSTGEDIVACDTPTAMYDCDVLLYFPCHAACVKIAKTAALFIASERPRSSSVLTATQRLWKTLVTHWRCIIKRDSLIDPFTNLRNAAKYGDLWRHQEPVWHPRDEDEEVSELIPMLY